MSVLCVISARGGSQGVPGKNVRPMLGVPLIARAVALARSSPLIDLVAVSTDSPAIAEAAASAGADIPFERPSALAQSDTGKFQVWQHALRECERHYGKTFELYVDIDCTNPLIEVADVQASISMFRDLRSRALPVDAVFTVARARRNPYFNLVEPRPDGSLAMSKTLGATVLSRQKAPAVFEHVAGVYVLDPGYLRSANHLLEGHARGYEVPEDKALDVDTELDFQFIEFILSRRASSQRG
jgi:CMP-N,N'-diacetyllegionaminic acid synthase